ncbi:MAG: metallophosphoesterase [Lachnospiraceae bacterium]|nr:metallophosphoesterase [Lachnospiraceae bacterium]
MNYVGKGEASLTFTLFSDFHYKAKMYPTTIADLKSILDRADKSNSAFVMSAGDFCNDALGSPELFSTYHNYYTQEGELLRAYNIYGNHELESTGNSMEVVTALLTNDSSVVWGTTDGSYDSSVGYYYFESNGFRVVCTDNNYSWNPTGEYWEHNRTKSYGAPSGNTSTYSLGPEQLAWLERVLTDAADQDIPCIIVEHSASAEVSGICRKVNAINSGTVLMCISGHTHTDEQKLDDGVFHLVCNTTRNGRWIDGGTAHYTSEHTFMYEDYDDEGSLLSTYEMELGSLKQGSNTWFFTEPLSAVITINKDGVIVVDGCESSWAYDIVPVTAGENCVPRISSGTYRVCDMPGDDMA